MEGIEAMQFNEPTPVQQQVIPEIINERDVIAFAQTGTGKTAAFLLPVIHRIITAPREEKVKALVIVPTRELAVQISQHMEGFGYFTPVSSLAIYGGGSGVTYANEQRALTNGVEMVVCTPGRLISHLNMGHVDFSAIDYLILDEADRMLDMGFFDDIMKIISFLPGKRQTMLFSATMPPKIKELSRKIMHKPREINIGLSSPPEEISQEAFVIYEDQKPMVVDKLIQDDRMQRILIFCGTKTGVKQLAKRLKSSNRTVEEIHSDLEQTEREKVMNGFKNKQIRILVATDIVSRGIDVEDIDMVINYDVPGDAEDYVHRIGRTARAGAHGKAVTLISRDDQYKFASIEKLLDKSVAKSPVPKNVGKTPEYQPKVRQQHSHPGRHPGKYRQKRKERR